MPVVIQLAISASSCSVQRGAAECFQELASQLEEFRPGCLDCLRFSTAFADGRVSALWTALAGIAG